MKIPFNIKFKPQIESGEYKVENRDGDVVTILEWDIFIHGMAHMILIRYNDKYEFVNYNGRINRAGQDCNLDLFLITPEPELSEFEVALEQMMYDWEDKGIEARKIVAQHIKELLELARKELEPEVLERLEAAYKNQDEVVYENGKRDGKAEALRTRATELTKNLTKLRLDTDSIPYHLIEFMCNLYTCQNWKEIEETAEAYVTRIKSAAMKDLPRWKSFRRNSQDYPFFSNCEDGENCLVFDGKCIKMCELLKLPGFKE